MLHLRYLVSSITAGSKKTAMDLSESKSPIKERNTPWLIVFLIF